MEAAANHETTRSLFRSYSIPLVLLLLMPCLKEATAQPVYRQSWTMQEKEFGLRQDLARFIIRSANDYLTRDDPNGPVARLDDRLRVTVIGELAPSSGIVQNRLERLVIGTIVVDRAFDSFLDTPTVARIVRRDYFWRDEAIDVFNERLSPLLRSVVDSSLRNGRSWEFFASPQNVPLTRLAADESLVSLDEATALIAGLGNESIALPMFTYGRARVGVRRGDLRAWAELPAAVGKIDHPTYIARGLDGRFGLGLSFESRWIGGMIAGTFGETTYGPAGTNDGSHYVMKSAGRLHAIVPIPLHGNIVARLKVGAGYRAVDALAIDNPRHNPLLGNERFVFTGEIDLLALDGTRGIEHRAGVCLFDQSLLATYEVAVFGPLGVRIAANWNGIFGRRDPWLPSYTISLLPTLTIW